MKAIDGVSSRTGLNVDASPKTLIGRWTETAIPDHGATDSFLIPAHDENT